MPIEFEAKFLDINEEEIKLLLKKIGAKKIQNRLMLKRTAYNICDKNIKGFVRVRDEGTGIITMTSKQYKDAKFPEENEVIIKNSYETGCKFIESLGFPQNAIVGIFCGSLYEDKQLEFLLKASAILHKKYQNFRLLRINWIIFSI